MQYLNFSNPGEIDPRLIITMGTNVKADPTSAIGFFGTGLKYAIAVTLRLGGSVIIQSGTHMMDFYSINETLRGKTFGFIRMRGQPAGAPSFEDIPLGFTTELGKLWAPWMAYREFYCNMKDEGGEVSEIAELPEPEPGLTRVLISCEELFQVHRGQKDWLLNPANEFLLWSTPGLEVYSGPGRAGFYRGIKVIDLPKPSTFIYNILAPMALTEDRTLDHFAFTHLITSEVMGRNKAPIPLDILESIAKAKKDFVERDWYWTSYIEPREELLSMPSAGLSPNLREALAAHKPAKGPERTKYDDILEDAPPIPNFTCPVINPLQEALANLTRVLRAGQVREARGEAVIGLCSYVADKLEELLADHPGVESPLEQLRAMNTALREAVQYWQNETKALTDFIPSSKEEI